MRRPLRSSRSSWTSLGAEPSDPAVLLDWKTPYKVLSCNKHKKKHESSASTSSSSSPAQIRVGWLIMRIHEIIKRQQRAAAWLGEEILPGSWGACDCIYREEKVRGHRPDMVKRITRPTRFCWQLQGIDMVIIGVVRQIILRTDRDIGVVWP